MKVALKADGTECKDGDPIAFWVDEKDVQRIRAQIKAARSDEFREMRERFNELVRNDPNLNSGICD